MTEKINKDIIETVVRESKKFQKKIKIKTKKNELKIEPKKITFYNTNSGDIYKSKIKITNITAKILTIIVSLPKYDIFTLEYEYFGKLSPGLSKEFEIIYKCEKNNFQFKDFISITTKNGFNYNLNISCKVKEAKIIYPPLVDLGFINTNEVFRKSFFIKNLGKEIVELFIEKPLNYNELNILNNMPIYINPNKKKEIILQFFSKSSGLINLEIVLKKKNHKINPPIKLIGTLLNSYIDIIDKTGITLKEFDFGNILYGKEKELTFYIINNQSEELSFDINTIFSNNLNFLQEDLKIQTPNEFGIDKCQNIVTIYPKKDIIEPFETKEIKFTLKSSINDEIIHNVENLMANPIAEPIKKKINAIIDINFNELNHQIKLNIIYKSPQINISDLEFLFGNVKIGDKKIEVLEIESKEKHNNILIEFKNNSQFKTNISKFVLKAQQKEKINLIFEPKNLGKFIMNLVLIVNREFKVKIVCNGNCLSKIKKPENIKLPKLASTYSVSTNRILKKNELNNSVKKIIAISKRKLFKTERPNNKLVVKKEKVNNDYLIDRTYKPNPNIPGKIYEISLSNKKYIKQSKNNLTPEQLRNILIGPKEINFNVVNVYSTNLKYFKIKNENSVAISAKLDLLIDELEESYDKIQIIPPDYEVTFPIKLISNKVQNINTLVKYLINEIHEFYFKVEAKIIPVKIVPNKKQVKFVFSDDIIELESKENLLLTNNGNSTANFNCYCTGKYFDVDIKNSYINSGETIKLELIYKPNKEGNIHDEKLIIVPEHGEKEEIKLLGYVNEVDAKLNTDNIDFGSISVAQKFTKNFIISNESKYNLIYNIDNLPNEYKDIFVIKPNKGKIFQNHQEKIEINIKTKKEMIIKKFPLKINIRGSKSIVIYLNAEIVIPEIEVNPREFDLKEIYYGNSISKNFKIFNHSNIPAQTQIKIISILKTQIDIKNCNDISNNNNIHIFEKEILEETKENETEEENFYHSFNSENEEKTIENDEDYYEENKSESNDFFSTKTSKLIIISLGPKSKIELKLTFNPLQSDKFYDFNIPISLEGYLDKQNYNLRIKCNSLAPLFFFEPENAVIDFEKISESNFSNMKPITKWFVIRNINHPENIEYELTNFEKNIYNELEVINSKGTIKSNSNGIIEFIFFPKEYCNFNDKYILKLKQSGKLKLVNLYIKGEVVSPSIYFKRKEVILPVVPLGCTSIANLKIYNDGYMSTGLKLKLDDEFDNTDKVILELDFVKDSRLTTNFKETRIEIKFTSLIPISFTKILEIRDDINKVYKIPISGTSDNSFLTNSFFFNKYSDSTEINFKSNELNVKINKLKNSYSNLKEVKKSVISDKNIEYIDFLKLNGEVLKDWINNQNICSLIYNYPSDLIESNGIQIYHLLESLLGKNNIIVKTKKQINFDLSTNDKIQLLLEQYNNLFHELKLDGLFLNNLRPEFLLNLIDLNNYYRNYPNKLFRISKINENNFLINSLENWNYLILQIIKVYILNKIKIIDIRQLVKNYEHLEVNIDLIKSNFLSSRDLLLWKWIEIINVIEENKPNSFRIYSFDEYFVDFSLIFNVCCFYNPYLRKKFNSDIDQVSLKTILNEFGLNYLNKMGEYGPYELESYLTIIELYANLPNFLEYQNIQFDCELNQNLTKNVQIINNSINTLFFGASIYSENNDFKIENDIVKVDPKSNTVIPISFFSRISLPIKAILVLIPKNKTGIFIKPLLYKLVSNVIKIKENKTIKLNDVKLYNNKNIELNLKNPFDKDCDFKIKMKKININNQWILDPFILINNHIKVLKNSIFIYKIMYFPIQLKEVQIYLSFLDEFVGEYVVKLIAFPEYPVEDNVYLNYELEKKNNLQHKISLKNNQLYNSLASYKNFFKQNLKEIEEKIDIIFKNKNKFLNFNIKISETNILKINKNLKLVKNKDNYLNFNCNTEKPLIDYKLVLILENYNKFDIRVFFINLNIIPKIVKANIELKSAVNTEISQNIPIYNPTNKVAMFAFEMLDINHNIYEGNEFFLEGHIQIASNEKKDYIIKYKPNNLEKTNLIIKIQNKISGEIFKFNLLGIPLPPYAKEIKEIDVKINKKTESFLIINNKKSNIIDYEIFHKINSATFPSNIIVEGKSSIKLPFSILSNNKGKIIKKVKLINKNNKSEYIWFILSINTIGENKIYKESISTEVRKWFNLKIDFLNNSKIKSEFFVEMNHPDIYGLKKFTIEPNSKYIYEINFLPLNIYDNSETMIFFKSNNLGEKIYKINLKSIKQKSVKIKEVNSLIGFKNNFLVKIRNFSFSQECKCKLNLIGSKSFWINSDQEIKVKPREYFDVFVDFTPLTVDKYEEAQLVVLPDNQAKWIFDLKGKGILSKDIIKTFEIKGELNKPTIYSINYHNPFHEEIKIEAFIDYNNKNEENILTFNNGKKSQKIWINEQEIATINLLFKPVEISQFKFNFFIKILDSFFLKYTIICISSKTLLKKIDNFEIISGKVLEKTLKVKLEGLNKKLDDEIDLNYEIESENKILNKWCNIYGCSLNENYLSMIIKFSPFKPIKCKGFINIYFKNNGMWRFPIKFEAKLPDIYTELVIYGSPSEPGKVIFPFKAFDSKKEKNFKCYLTPNSSPEFSVSPETGNIYPYKTVNITIRYDCLDYRDNREAEMRIETLYNLVRIKIIGKIPKYIPPIKIKKKKKLIIFKYF